MSHCAVDVEAVTRLAIPDNKVNKLWKFEKCGLSFTKFDINSALYASGLYRQAGYVYQ